jgi:uncharacterized membrane protein YphA (DoxX/SURF4 family)
MSAVKTFLFHRSTVRVAQIVIGALMGWAALAKLGNLAKFAEQVHNFRVLPIAAENLVAMTLPWIELVAALSLVLGVRARSGGVVVSALLTVFTAGVISAVARGLDFECGCFGTSDATRVGWVKILANLGMLALALLASARPVVPDALERSDAVAAAIRPSRYPAG